MIWLAVLERRIFEVCKIITVSIQYFIKIDRRFLKKKKNKSIKKLKNNEKKIRIKDKN